MEEILIFGRGDYFKKKEQELFKRYHVIGFLDNAVCDEIMDNDYCIPIYNPKKVDKIASYDIYCISADIFGMWKQLKELGVEDDRIHFGVEIEPLQPGMEEAAFSNGEKLSSEGDHLSYICHGINYKVTCLDELKEVLREHAKNEFEDISLIKNLSITPVSRIFGSERGKAVDRYYIEKFLNVYSNDIRGTVMEVANNKYTTMFGGVNVEKSIVCHVLGLGNNSIKVNFETGEGIIENSVDCLICTQTLQYIFDLKEAILNIYKVLRSKGVALITVPGIKPLCEYDSNLWGEYWSFTRDSVDRLCNSLGSNVDYEVGLYGNCKAATAYLYGICLEEMNQIDLDFCDSQYPFIITARIVKK